MGWNKSCSRGQALIEFALLTPLFALMTAALVWVVGITNTRLKVQEAAWVLTEAQARAPMTAQELASLAAELQGNEKFLIQTGPFKETAASKFYGFVFSEVRLSHGGGRWFSEIRERVVIQKE